MKSRRLTKSEHNHETWFYRGREAAGKGHRRIITNGRLTHANRQSWYQGWDHETRLRSPKPTPEQVTEFNTFFRALAAEVRTSINTPL